ncbi:MAG: NAD(P)H-hydrate dehydratase [Chloroflexi bacterium]|nr:NAD(P)H-hydrate dehydratase [Chloroflexota bacterium]MBV9595832.1 NAD(P)H-hydrate dehydratase [Chloroflexota bacterium]
MNIVSVEEMRALEAAAFAAGCTEAELQERAGQAVAEEVLRMVDVSERLVVLVGHGNNGRDGAVAARRLLERGLGVDLVLAPRHAVRPDELAWLRGLGASLVASEDGVGVDRALTGAQVAVDALAGIGARGALREPLASLAARLNAAREGRRVVALDLPSGVDADTGEVPGEAVWADATVTLGGVKQGLLRFPAAERVGRLIPRQIGLAESSLPYTILDETALRRLVPARGLDAHKYRFGRALVAAGSDHFLGAPVLCAGAAARVGAGLVTVASTRDVRLNVAGQLPEATFSQTEIRADEGAAAARALEPYLQSYGAVVVGPGLGRGAGTTEFVRELLCLRPREHTLVIDADGLVALSEIDNWVDLVDGNVVLTPHSGELERLVGHGPSGEETVWSEAGRLAREWGCVLAAKGPFTCIAAPSGRVDVWPRANAALATGGTGDVLAGITTGLLAQGLPAWDAARLAVGVHGLAAANVVQRGWRTLLASDLFAEIPPALGALSQLG